MKMREWFGVTRWKSLLALVPMLCVLGLEARAEGLTHGVGVGLGEVGTVGAVYRLRSGSFAFEPGIGVYTYSVEAEDAEGTRYGKSGAAASVGANVLYYLSAPQDAFQYGALFSFGYQKITGPVYAFGCRFEYPLADKVGIHAGLGVSFAPDFSDRVESFVEDETGVDNLDADTTYVPLYLNVGLHF